MSLAVVKTDWMTLVCSRFRTATQTGSDRWEKYANGDLKKFNQERC